MSPSKAQVPMPSEESKKIAISLNQVLNPKGIKIAVSLTAEGMMTVTAQSKELPEQSLVVEAVRSELMSLELSKVKRVLIRGQITGNKTSAWRETIELLSSSITPSTNSTTKSSKAASEFNQFQLLAKATAIYTEFREVINTLLLGGILFILVGSLNTLRYQQKQVAQYIQQQNEVKWEYKIKSFEDYELDTQLVQLGNEGWDLVFARRALTGEGEYSRRGVYECIFKRAKKTTLSPQ